MSTSISNKIKNETPFSKIVSGPQAFYNDPDYKTKTKKDFSSNTCLPVSYKCDIEDRICRIVKNIILNIILYNLVHGLIGFVIVPSATYSRKEITDKRKAQIEYILRNDRSIFGKKKDTFKYKRITIEVDGHKLDVTIMGKPSTLGTGKWIIKSCGNGEIYENSLDDPNFKQVLHLTKSNGIIYNYPFVGAGSDFLPNKMAMIKAYQAVLSFLEDQKKGIGAKEIATIDFSIGAGVQGDSLNNHELNKDLKYVFTKINTFSELSKVVDSILFRPLGFLIKILGWNIAPVKSSNKLEKPEIVFQVADVEDYTELKDSSMIYFDGIIKKEASYAKALLDSNCPRKNKLFFGINQRHNEPIDPDVLAEKISHFLPLKEDKAESKSFLRRA